MVPCAAMIDHIANWVAFGEAGRPRLQSALRTHFIAHGRSSVRATDCLSLRLTDGTIARVVTKE